MGVLRKVRRFIIWIVVIVSTALFYGPGATGSQQPLKFFEVEEA
jgi:hypothetical protein